MNSDDNLNQTTTILGLQPLLSLKYSITTGIRVNVYSAVGNAPAEIYVWIA